MSHFLCVIVFDILDMQFYAICLKQFLVQNKIFYTGCALEKSAVNRPKNLLVFINPFGGKGQALNIFNTTVVPLFRLAGIKYKVVVTERANHARDMLR